MKKWIATLTLGITVSTSLSPHVSAQTMHSKHDKVQNIADNHTTISKDAKEKSTPKINMYLATQENIDYINDILMGQGWDFDSYAGFQCFDLANVYWYHLYGHGLNGSYAKDIPFQNNFSGEASVHRNTASFKAYPGDLVVFGDQYGNGMGHVAIVTNGNVDGNWNQFESLDQNWNHGGASKTETAHKVIHNYDLRSGQMYFIRSYR